jgi:hypothetical protein
MLRPHPLSLAGLLVCGITAIPAAAQTGPMDDLSQPAQPPLAGPPPVYSPPSPPGGRTAPLAGTGTTVPPGDGEGGSSRAARIVARFRAANTKNNGRLTLQQAQTAGLTPVVRHFAELDPTNRGYITLQDIRAFIQKMRAMRTQANPSQ